MCESCSSRVDGVVMQMSHRQYLHTDVLLMTLACGRRVDDMRIQLP